MTIYNHTFSNGLKLVYQKKDGANISGINIFVNVGSYSSWSKLLLLALLPHGLLFGLLS
tara:strand:+ start:932 stop:1108 length:177 start_codon:yes stop_codon:yes gene_type:complete